MSSAPGVEEISSSAQEGVANIRVSFAQGRTSTKRRTSCQVVSTAAEHYREDIEPPVMYKFDVASPVVFLTVGVPNMEAKGLRRFVGKAD